MDVCIDKLLHSPLLSPSIQILENRTGDFRKPPRDADTAGPLTSLWE